jgi:hypothetical protein
MLQARIDLLAKFVQARKVSKSDPEEMIKICRNLLDDKDVEVCWDSDSCQAKLGP